MKKTITIMSMLILVLLSISSTKLHAEENKLDYNQVYDMFITTLTPHIEEGIVNHYGYSKSYDLFNTKILNVDRLNSYHFKVTVQVKTFEHAHNPPYGTETMLFEVRPSGVKMLEFNHEGDEDEKEIQKFYNEAISDIKDSYNLELDDYEKYSWRQITYQRYKAEDNEEFNSLFNIINDIIMNSLNPEITPPYKNVIDPVTYIRENSGYILFKRADGRNIVYTIRREKNSWYVKDEQEKPGIKMEKELIWYM